MSEWKTRFFGDCAELIKDTYKPNEIESIPYIGLEHIEQDTLHLNGIGDSPEVISNKFRFFRDDILFGKLRPYFRKVICPDFDGVCSTDIFVVRAKPGTDQKFLYYWMATQEFVDLADLSSTGSRMPRAEWDFLQNLEKDVPQKDEQLRISKVLGRLDKSIHNFKNQNQILEKIIQSIFKSWFIDFDGQIAFVDSELGEIPKGWKIYELPEVCSIVDCLHITKSPEVENDAYLLQVFNIVDLGLIDLSKKFHVSQEEYSYWTKNIEVREGDCIVSNAGRVGAIGQIPYWLKGGIGRNLTAIRPIKITPTYLLEYLFSKLGQNQIEQQTDTATIFNTLNVRGIKKIKILIPITNMILKFESISRPLRRQIEINALQIEYLTKIRDSLLPKLISGEIRV